MSEQTKNKDAFGGVATEDFEGDDKVFQGENTERFKEERKNIGTWQMCVKEIMALVVIEEIL